MPSGQWEEAAVTKAEGRGAVDTEEHLKVHRPSGNRQSVDNGDRHQVKRIIVEPGQRFFAEALLSLTALIRGAGVAAQRDGQDGSRERVDLRSDRRRAPAGEPWQNPAGLDRGPDASYLGEENIICIGDDYRLDEFCDA
jgi:mannose-1-phosphate guanylyltransferase/mannose-6-phosphate isomerase